MSSLFPKATLCHLWHSSCILVRFLALVSGKWHNKDTHKESDNGNSRRSNIYSCILHRTKAAWHSENESIKIATMKTTVIWSVDATAQCKRNTNAKLILLVVVCARVLCEMRHLNEIVSQSQPIRRNSMWHQVLSGCVDVRACIRKAPEHIIKSRTS